MVQYCTSGGCVSIIVCKVVGSGAFQNMQVRGQIVLHLGQVVISGSLVEVKCSVHLKKHHLYLPLVK